jgi:hypothetical protein
MWYSYFFGISPYFAVAGYFRFRISDYLQDFRIIDRCYSQSVIPESPAGVVVYWHIDGLEHVSKKHLDYNPVKERGNGFSPASVFSPSVTSWVSCTIRTT